MSDSLDCGDSSGRYSDVCGATNRNGEPCGLPAGWGTPGSQGGRCKFHGGLSEGPRDTSYLEDNDHAVGNPGGGAPELNTNAEVHGGFADWEKAYERFDGETRAYVNRLIDSMRPVAEKYAADVPEDRRKRLLKEKATLSVLWNRAAFDVFASESDTARGFTVSENIDVNGEVGSVEKLNPAWGATASLSAREREIAKELRLWPGFRD